MIPKHVFLILNGKFVKKQNYDDEGHQERMDDFCEEYDEHKARLEDLQQIKIIIKQLEKTNENQNGFIDPAVALIAVGAVVIGGLILLVVLNTMCGNNLLLARQNYKRQNIPDR